MTTYQHAFRAMASTFSVRIDVWPHSDTSHVAESIEGLLRELEEETRLLERTLSRFDSRSELMLLAANLGQPHAVSDHLHHVLKLAQEMINWTNGAFNPAILPNLEALGYPGSSHVLLNSSLSPVPTDTVLFEEIGASTIALTRPIDLGGIGKGYTADFLAKRIDERQNRSLLAGYVIDAGGDIVVSGCQDSGEAWSIGIENPHSPQNLCAVISPGHAVASRLAICTSSLWRKSWSYEGRKVHHLIDPATGRSAVTNLLSVTALGSEAALTEIVTKYVFLRGFEPAKLWHHCPLKCLWVTQDGQLGMTDDILPHVTWTQTSLMDE